MKKLLIIIVVGLLVATGASYFGMQWKVRQTLDDFFQNMPFAEGSYGDFSFDLNGKMTVHDIIIEVPIAGIAVDVGSVSFATSNFWETLNMEKSIQNGQLPKAMQVEISEFSFDLNRDTLESFSQQGLQQGLFAELSTLGCGRYTSLTPVNYYDMGLNNITFDLSVGYQYDDGTDEMVSSIDMYLDSVGRLEMDQTIIGLFPVMENYHNAMFGLDPSSISTTNVSLAYTDLGYNSKFKSFCSIASGMDKEEWVDHHLEMFGAALDQLEFTADFDALGAYRKLLDDRSYIEVDLRPLSGFNMGDLQFYGASELIELVDLKVSLNDEPLEIHKVDWKQENVTTLNLAKIRKEYRVSNSSDAETESATTANSSTRMLKAVPVSSLEQHLHRTVLIERKDGSKFTGEMISANANRVVVRTRFSAGFTDLPLARDQISEVKLYPEE